MKAAFMYLHALFIDGLADAMRKDGCTEIYVSKNKAAISAEHVGKNLEALCKEWQVLIVPCRYTGSDDWETVNIDDARINGTKTIAS